MLPFLASGPLTRLVTAGLALVVSGALPLSAATPSAPPGPSRTAPSWRLPLPEPPVVLRAFDPPTHAWLPGHRGVDLAGVPGTPVRAAGAGTVTWAGPLVDRGVVVVTHADGLRTTYEPVDAAVSVGDLVAAGEVIGSLGSGDVHCGSFPQCLHWGLRRGRDYLDPMLLVDPGHAVLLPP